MSEEKPPLGIMPYKIWVALRVQDLLEAMKRYSEANMVIPKEWIEELEKHLSYEIKDVSKEDKDGYEWATKDALTHLSNYKGDLE